MIEPGSRLPALALRPAAGGAPVPLRPPPRHSRVLVLVHGAECGQCADLVALLAAEQARFQEWDADPIVVLAMGLGGAGAPRAPYPVLVDAERRLAAALGVEAPAVVVADQWGEIHLRERAGDEHAFVSVPELVSWAQYLAIQCPECQGEAY